MRKLAIVLLTLALLRILQLATGWEIPLVKWLSVAASAVGALGLTLLTTTLSLVKAAPSPATLKAMQAFVSGLWVFWSVNLVCLAALGLGVYLLQQGDKISWDPLTLKRWKRFRSLRRGYVSMWILGALVFIALLDNVLVGKRALLVKYDGHVRCPFLEADPIMGREFGVTPGNSETDYRELKERFQGTANWVLMPLVPYDARADTPPVMAHLEKRGDGIYYEVGEVEPYTGTAAQNFKEHPDVKRQDLRFQAGKLHGGISLNDAEGSPVERVTYENGVEQSRVKLNESDAAALDAAANPQFQVIKYAPTPPSWRHRHFLGTDSSGGDILAIMIGAFQLIIGGTLFFLVVTYLIGVVVGGLTGYLGGWIDLLAQRGIEIWSSMPFLYVIILLRSLNERPSLLFVITALAAFSWMGISAYMRTATFREKNRDYVAAARLMGASNRRMVFTHILPNTLSVLITLLPFKVDALIAGLTSLDYLGFGLPVGEPSWGVLLKDGVDNLAKPWILMSGFAALASVLVLVTFIGEAIREAFDPRKFTYYE